MSHLKVVPRGITIPWAQWHHIRALAMEVMAEAQAIQAVANAKTPLHRLRVLVAKFDAAMGVYEKNPPP